MNQQDFTDYIIPKILESFPQFKEHCERKLYDIIEIRYKSINEELTLYLTTQDKEITIGFEADNELDNWHTHMNLFGAKTPDEELNVAVALINDILSDKVKIFFSNEWGYFLSEDIEDDLDNKDKIETIEIKYWSEL